ncbi:MAG: hypothetical protein AAFP92_08610, partial [Bacteroidota bacterium]
PEFQIHTSATSINYINLVYGWFIKDYLGEIATHAGTTVHNAPSYELDDLDPVDYLYLDLEAEYQMAADAPALVARLNLILTGGQFSKETISHIVQAVEQVKDPVQRVRIALFLSFIAPDYCIQK